MLRRVRMTAAEVGDRFPLHADPSTGRWTTTRRGSWAGGFWAGLLWLVAARSGEEEDRERAGACTARLRERVGDDTDTRAFTFWYGAAQGHLLCGQTDAASVAREGAAALAGAWDVHQRFIPAGTALGRGPLGAQTLSVDTAGAVVALLSWAGRAYGHPQWITYARQHIATVLEHCLDRGAAVRPSAVPGGRAHAVTAGEWPRGQAWGMLAFAVAAGLTEDGLARDVRDAACRATDLWLGRTGGGVPPWSFTDPSGPRDTSAAAIAAEAMLLLAGAVDEPRSAAYRAAATRLLDALVTRHLTLPGTGAGAPPAGMLLDGCYDMASGTAVANELVWGDYFLFSALLRQLGQNTSTMVSGPGA
ncbi:sugar ABC transporter permease [Streptomyces sp. URMC 127]|uniref:sugar ABC transporter permease n=1 Tax=Streptomyces sp. URMC 127 TaxID=3423402 RepID=UPI003F199CC2